MKRKPQPQTVEHRCGECANATEYASVHNMSVKGETICARCKFQKWAVLKSAPACGKFKKKP